MLDIDYRSQVAKILIDIESVKFSFDKPFTLTSGLKSPVYVDCRKIISFVEERKKIINFAKNYFLKNKVEFDILAGGETAGIPYASFLAESLNSSMIYVRKKSKDFGKNQQIEGNYKKNQKVLLIEDLATDGGSKVIFVEALRKANLKISDVFVIFYYDIFDIEKSPLNSLKIKIHSLCTWKDIIDNIKINKKYSSNQIQDLENFLKKPDVWRKENG